ncbi:MAG: MarR family transcriptional regulator [candidate division KSB1 bacterium]|nr:MarR family transcriptional regulator [candidate division KSB1 bacterium]MDZ7275601.1 MarR family transcriptional regulator [candidate division KSB1 bacterium]MDZ7284708.1 MarR family transcriptional regulator [candidate division KSB1 bacterium]MDZ7297873.1 MarR family transcriptional regulator [candidate division KSB1 bacterium]MDZ7305999.1 MarR family transcriptional regulator [candidate division KSB1 bacterium]
MNPDAVITQQVERLQRLTKELLRKYQMRDRNEIACCGVTVSQCYAVDALGENGEMTMVQLAKYLFLDKSTCTRVIDPLVQRGLVERQSSRRDRREIIVRLTAAGSGLQRRIRAELHNSQRQILARLPVDKREQVLESLELLSLAVHDWLATCCCPEKVTKPQNLKRLNLEGRTHA